MVSKIYQTWARILIALCKPLSFVLVSKRSQLHHWVTARERPWSHISDLGRFSHLSAESLKSFHIVEGIASRRQRDRTADQGPRRTQMRFLGNVLSGASSPRFQNQKAVASIGEDLETEKRETAMWRKTATAAAPVQLHQPIYSLLPVPLLAAHPSRPLLRSFFAADDFFTFLSPFPGQLTNGMFSVSACDVHFTGPTNR